MPTDSLTDAEDPVTCFPGLFCWVPANLVRLPSGTSTRLRTRCADRGAAQRAGTQAATASHPGPLRLGVPTLATTLRTRGADQLGFVQFIMVPAYSRQEGTGLASL